MSTSDRFLHRGTTPGWPGNVSLQKEGKTCTTTDPLVATLFAIECPHHGPSTVLLAPMTAFDGLTGPTNHAAIFEREIVVNLLPLDFARG
jgi:hypothetical protein